MSNLILNIRFGAYHWQIVRLRDWPGELFMRRLPFRVSFNPAHAIGALGRNDEWKWFEAYEGGPLAAGILLALAMSAGMIWSWIG